MASPLLLLPAELRLHIWELLLAPLPRNDTITTVSRMCSSQLGNIHRTAVSHDWDSDCACNARSFYLLDNNKPLSPALLRANHHVYQEALPCLYRHRTFSTDPNRTYETLHDKVCDSWFLMDRFLAGLSETARSNIHSVKVPMLLSRFEVYGSRQAFYSIASRLPVLKNVHLEVCPIFPTSKYWLGPCMAFDAPIKIVVVDKNSRKTDPDATQGLPTPKRQRVRQGGSFPSPPSAYVNHSEESKGLAVPQNALRTSQRQRTRRPAGESRDSHSAIPFLPEEYDDPAPLQHVPSKDQREPVVSRKLAPTTSSAQHPTIEPEEPHSPPHSSSPDPTSNEAADPHPPSPFSEGQRVYLNLASLQREYPFYPGRRNPVLITMSLCESFIIVAREYDETPFGVLWRYRLAGERPWKWFSEQELVDEEGRDWLDLRIAAGNKKRNEDGGLGRPGRRKRPGPKQREKVEYRPQGPVLGEEIVRNPEVTPGTVPVEQHDENNEDGKGLLVRGDELEDPWARSRQDELWER
ncbi:hypothetical protein FKW77_000965 [Venturia effusa]|uniref:DUF7730 domain-containing protein n=1 Tax=Venturia effusa TaxID=50376 RepID=A0A517L6K8_9PEZI|nr:hypothetical protein FKW77_000965 [Venturia effusa]